MTHAVQAVLAEALRLDVEARTELAAGLLGSSEGPADRDAETAWNAEIRRRVAAIEAGTQDLEPWEEVRRRISPCASGSRIRRVLVAGFPYQVVYAIRLFEIVVVAIAHLRRRPAYWTRRD